MFVFRTQWQADHDQEISTIVEESLGGAVGNLRTRLCVSVEPASMSSG